MNAKELEILKKLLKIATNQQKVIEKLAQTAAPATTNTPEWLEQFKPKLEGDPLDGDLGDHRTPDQVTQDVYKNFPWLKKQPATITPRNPGQTPATSISAGLPKGVKEMLDTGAPGFKNSLNLSFGGPDGKDVTVNYRSDRFNIIPSGVKRVLTNALPGYRVGDPVGYNNPDPTTWHPNY